jgi:hypothetical protein
MTTPLIARLRLRASSLATPIIEFRHRRRTQSTIILRPHHTHFTMIDDAVDAPTFTIAADIMPSRRH